MVEASTGKYSNTADKPGSVVENLYVPLKEVELLEAIRVSYDHSPCMGRITERSTLDNCDASYQKA